MATPAEQTPFVGDTLELQDEIIVSDGSSQTGSRVSKQRLGVAATILVLIVATAGILLHKPSTKATFAPSTHVEEEVEMVEDDVDMADQRDLTPNGYCQIYVVPVNFWDRYTTIKGSEPSANGAMRTYFAKWGSEDGKRPHVTITRDKKFTQGDTKAACREAAKKAMIEFWKSTGESQNKRFSLDTKKLTPGYSPKAKANKLKFKTGGEMARIDALEKFFRVEKKWPETPMPLHATHVSDEKSPSYKAAVEEHDWRVVANFKVSGGDREWLWLGDAGKL